MRNVELKARDPDPARSLERTLALGAEDKGEIRQRDTYFAGARGRIKLREQNPGDDELIQYSREDSTDARTSSYRRVPTGAADALRAALEDAYGTLVTVTKRRRLLLWEGVRIHLDEVEGLGSYLEFEAVATPSAWGEAEHVVQAARAGFAPDSDLSAEHEKVARLRAELGIDDDDLIAASYSDLLLGAPNAAARAGDDLMRAADEVMRTAYAPYSQFRVGAALRAPDGSIYLGSNVENGSYPQGQCAETSAIGALIAGGRLRIAEVAVTAERMEICPPCGGCRQRLAEFASADTPVHLGRLDGPRQMTTIGELLPLAFELE